MMQRSFIIQYKSYNSIEIDEMDVFVSIWEKEQFDAEVVQEIWEFWNLSLEYRETLIKNLYLSLKLTEIQREIAKEREQTIITFSFDAEVVLV